MGLDGPLDEALRYHLSGGLDMGRQDYVRLQKRNPLAQQPVGDGRPLAQVRWIQAHFLTAKVDPLCGQQQLDAHNRLDVGQDLPCLPHGSRAMLT